MKLVLLLLVVISGSLAQAQNTVLNSAQTQKIEAAILTSCGYMRDLTQVSQTEEVVVVDQGVRDVYFTNVFTGERRLDQNIFDRYDITVKSILADGYDHQENAWGIFAIESVSCNPAQ